jgi:hypothetical protein
MILNRFCLRQAFGQDYPFCLARAGSGFVNKDGYIAAMNVVSYVPETTITNAITGGLDNLLIDSLQAYYSAVVGSPVDHSTVETKSRKPVQKGNHCSDRF